MRSPADSLRAGIRDEEDALGFFRFTQWTALHALIELCADQGDPAAAWRVGRRAEALPRLESLEQALSGLWDAIAAVDPEYVSFRRGDAVDLAALRALLPVDD